MMHVSTGNNPEILLYGYLLNDLLVTLLPNLSTPGVTPSISLT
jgi:hypothetical protein